MTTMHSQKKNILNREIIFKKKEILELKCSITRTKSSPEEHTADFSRQKNQWLEGRSSEMMWSEGQKEK